MAAEHSLWSWLGKRSLILELLLSRARSKRSYQSHKFGQKCSRLPDGRGSVQTADSIEPRASASGVELFDELPGHNTRQSGPRAKPRAHLAARGEPITV